MICRKDTLGYVDFVRGKYPLHNDRYIKNIVDEMSLKEKDDILNKTFQELWRDLWGCQVGAQYKGEEKMSFEKINALKAGIVTGNNTLKTLETYVRESSTFWSEPEWGFPKGRRNSHEKDLTCACREWEEETGYCSTKLTILNNLVPYEEIFTGSNYKSYKHKYYVGHCVEQTDSKNYEKNEVSKIEWKTYEQCMECIRPYNLEKKNVLKKINTLLTNYIIEI